MRPAGRHPYHARMANGPATRLELKLAPERRRQLDELAAASGVSATDLCRLAITQLLEDRTVRLPQSEAA